MTPDPIQQTPTETTMAEHTPSNEQTKHTPTPEVCPQCGSKTPRYAYVINPDGPPPWEICDHFWHYTKPQESHAAMQAVVSAAEEAWEHLNELREAWMSGALRETDGGTRSNRNVDVEVNLRAALAAVRGTQTEKQR